MGKKKMPQIGEAVFCIIYLLFGFIAGIYMLCVSGGRDLITLYGALTLTLVCGDSFHLVPRIINAFSERFERYEFWAGLGLLVSSISMTAFYLVLYQVCQLLAADHLQSLSTWKIVLWILAILRMALCLFPQNNWFHKEGSQVWGILRNVPFVFVGLIMICVCIMIGQLPLAIAIVISFGCYLPVVIWAKKKPMIGMLMIPKTMAYMWMICIGLGMI